VDEYLTANQALWDEWVKINSASKLYDLESFKAGRCSLKALELEEVGDVQGKSLLHLQCHFGMDSLSWARRGAKVTGVDFSPQGIHLAQALSAELSIPARFLCCNLYDLPEQLDEQFDVVFTSYGALTWLPDRRRWAQIAARYVKPGGIFYIAEFHPFAMVFDDFASSPQVKYPYFDDGVIACDVQGSYADRSAETKSKHSYEWAYPLGEVVSELIAAGLRIQFLHEWPFTCNPMFPFLVESEKGLWRMPEGMKSLPLQFSIRAQKD
jgi:SAM-dependent methyltransferase